MLPLCCIIFSEGPLAVMPGLPAQGISPGRKGGMRMAKNDKGRSFYEWATLIIKLLTALAALVAAVTELLRLS